MNDLDTDQLLEGSAKGKKAEDRFRAIRKRYQDATDACQELYAEAVDDFKFAWVPGNQWDAAMSALRGTRPKYEFNNLRQSIKQVLNDNRQNTPSIKIAATRDATVDMAELREGIIRNIESQSNADSVYDWGALYSVTAGFGVWRVVTEYADDDAFEQDIRIRRIENPFSVKFDPAARRLDRSDGRFLFIEEDVTRSEFKHRYPDADCESFEAGKPGYDKSYASWCDKDTIRVCEYWQKKRKTREIYQLSDGRVVDGEKFDLIAKQAANPPIDPQTMQPTAVPITIKTKRTVEYDKISSEIISGKETLAGPFVWAGKYIPVIPCWGDIVNVDGADYWCGMVRYSRDSQILFNFSQSNLAEAVASQPRAPWLYTPAMVEGHEQAWTRSAVDNPVGLPYNVDPTAPGGGRPSREAPPLFSTAWFDLAKVNADNLKSTTGIYDASLGQRSNETSGVAISNRARQSGLANFDYQDNIAKAVQFTGVIVDDLIGPIYDTERELRILGADQQSKYIQVNKPVFNPETQKWEKENDLSSGKYDVTITTGPSFTTQRMETLTAMTELARSPNPQFAALASYGVLKNMDVPGLDEITKGARKLLVTQGLLEPGEKDGPPPGPPPEIQQAMAQIQEQGQQLQQDQMKLAGEKSAVDSAKVQVQAAQQVLNADVAKSKAEIENMLLKAQPQEGAQQPAQAPQSQAGESVMAFAVAQSLTATLERTEAVAATLGQAEEVAQRIEQAAQMTIEASQAAIAAASVPKVKEGTMTRNADGSYNVRVVEA